MPPTAAPNGTAIIISPGGGYARLAMSAEPAGIASRLQATGTATFILKYRLGEYGFPAPLQDVVRAMRMLRSRASEFGLRSDRIGLIGASAGGHVAAMAATMWDAPEARTGGPLDSVNGRPDFVATQTANRETLTDQRLKALFWLMPLLTLKVVAAIHWEALRLLLKGAPFGARPPGPAAGLSAGEPLGLAQPKNDGKVSSETRSEHERDRLKRHVGVGNA